MTDVAEPMRRLLLIEPPSSERRERIMALMELGLDVSLADEVKQALREREPTDVLVFRLTDRKLALRSLVSTVRSKSPNLVAFVLGGSPEQVQDLNAILTTDSVHVPDDSPDALQRVVSERLLLPASEEVEAPSADEPDDEPTLNLQKPFWAPPGGSIEVWLADQGGKQVVLMRTGAGWNEQWIKSLVETVGRAGRVKHPCLATIERAWAGATTMSAVYTATSGAPLTHTLRHETLAPPEAVPIVRSLTDALRAMHSADNPIRFGPVPPSLVWLDEAKAPRFLLAGASWVAHAQARANLGPGTAPQRTYIAPEEIKGAVGDERTDVFFAAILLFELLTGSDPFPRGDIKAYLNAIRTGEGRNLQMYLPSVDDALAQLVATCLQPDPGARPTPAELGDALGRYV